MLPIISIVGRKNCGKTTAIERLIPEFADELLTRGRIYGYRFRPPGAIRAKPVEDFVSVIDKELERAGS